MAKSSPLFLDAKRMPFWLYVPNLVGYLRYVLLALGMLNPSTEYGLWCFVVSLSLDFIDGPLARRYGMCTQFGDLLDHVCDHVTILAVVVMTSSSRVNVWVNAVHFVVAIGYMIYYGHYFKHSKGGNIFTKEIEKNNYFNMLSCVWAGNSMIFPLLKMSYALDHNLAMKDTTGLMDIIDHAGMLVCVVYTLAVLK